MESNYNSAIFSKKLLQELKTEVIYNNTDGSWLPNPIVYLLGMDSNGIITKKILLIQGEEGCRNMRETSAKILTQAYIALISLGTTPCGVVSLTRNWTHDFGGFNMLLNKFVRVNISNEFGLFLGDNHDAWYKYKFLPAYQDLAGRGLLKITLSDFRDRNKFSIVNPDLEEEDCIGYEY